MDHNSNTILKIGPEYLNKSLLLADPYRKGLFRTEDVLSIQVEINEHGEVTANEIRNGFRTKCLEGTLEGIISTYLGIKNISINQMLKYLVLPEMEVERIFNSARYKYLRAIFISGKPKPDEFISHEYNRAFQSLAGIHIRQGKTKVSRDNDSFWQDPGFDPKAKTHIEWDEDREALDFILKFIKRMKASDYTLLYAELIAIKPGFHEVWLHDDYFSYLPKNKSPREQVFGFLRGNGDLLDLRLDKMPREINKKDYFSYAPCNVTEGPFVFRRRIDVSYYDDIRQIKSKSALPYLRNQFHILDYRRKELDSLSKLKVFLNEAKKYTGFL